MSKTARKENYLRTFCITKDYCGAKWDRWLWREIDKIEIIDEKKEVFWVNSERKMILCWCGYRVCG
jgi:hypothetical protein